MGDRGATGKTPTPGQSQYGRHPGAMGPNGQSGQRRTPGLLSSSGRHPGYPGQPGLSGQQPRQQHPRESFDTPQNGRDRDASGSRWLND